MMKKIFAGIEKTMSFGERKPSIEQIQYIKDVQRIKEIELQIKSIY